MHLSFSIRSNDGGSYVDVTGGPREVVLTTDLGLPIKAAYEAGTIDAEECWRRIEAALEASRHPLTPEQQADFDLAQEAQRSHDR